MKNVSTKKQEEEIKRLTKKLSECEKSKKIMVRAEWLRQSFKDPYD